MTQIGRYEIESTLGRGAMGVVYLARDPIIGRKVALKTLRLDVDDDVAGEFRERFLREAQAAGRLNHPAIVTIHDVGEDRDSGLLYIAMEYIEGRDLKQILATGHRFRPAEAARIVADIAVALDYAHQMGVVHRDVKPANIILTRDGSSRIADFGIARLESSNLTIDGQFIGTPNFMSPEQIRGEALDGRSDLFSLGVVLFTLLTGQRPFTGDSMHEVTRKIIEEATPIPSRVDPSVPAAFNPIVCKCMDKTPERRFQTGGELAKVLAVLARSLVRRAPEDGERTSIHSPDLDTRAHRTPPPTALPGQSRDRSGVPAWLKSLKLPSVELPEPLTWEVTKRWSWVIVGAWSILWLAVIGLLAMRLSVAIPAAPSAGATRNLNRTVAALSAAEDALASGRFAAARTAAHRALDQAPGSPAARTLAARAERLAEDERTSAETQQQIADLVAEGRRLYRAGSYVAAATRFRDALELDPMSELATDYLELAEDRSRQARRQRASTAPARRDAPALELATEALPIARPTPGNARVTVYYPCPINAGAVTVAVDGATVAEIPFDFTERGFLGFKTEGSGTVKRVFLVPSGARDVEVSVREKKRGLIGSQSFSANLAAGSDWSLRINQAKPAHAPAFFFVRSSR